MKGWPLDIKTKPLCIGSCFYMLEMSQKTFSNLRALIPPLTIVDSTSKVPCCKGGKLPSERKPLDMEPLTTLTIDMIKIEGAHIQKVAADLLNKLAVKQELNSNSKELPNISYNL
jgi:hypothetical protein